MEWSNYKLKRLKLMASLCGDGKILDIGCHRPNPYLPNPVGIDKLEISKTKRKTTHSHYLNIIKFDINLNLPFIKNRFHNIVAGEIIEHLENPLFFLKECHRILKPMGKLILSTPNIFFYGYIYSQVLKGGYNKEHTFEIPFYCFNVLKEKSGFRTMKKIKYKPIFFLEKSIVLVFQK